MTSIKNINQIYFHKDSFKILPDRINEIATNNESVIFFIDDFFQNRINLLSFNFNGYSNIYFNNTSHEPTVELIDSYIDTIRSKSINPELIIAIGGGSTLDVGKAISNMLTNPGISEDYQGWDLVKNPGIYKIGVPTLSGTGAESSRTCVLTNKKKNLKMGMNSHFSIYDELILDPNLTKTVDKDQYFYSAMDTYIHSIESLNGSLKNLFSDTFSYNGLNICREVFNSDDFMSDENREKIMLASYFGGIAIANSMVGLVHPFSAGLSSVFGTHHCVSNCIVMMGMEDFYPDEYLEFKSFISKHNILLPKIQNIELNSETLLKLYDATIIHEKPLKNALGKNFNEILTFEKASELFRKILQ